MYIYICSETWLDDAGKRNNLYTVGFYKPDGKFETDSDYPTKHQARKRVNYLNGGTGIEEDHLSQLITDIGNYLARQ